MKQVALLSILLFITFCSYSQAKEFEEYYLQNKTIQSNKVKKQSDTSGQKIVTEFDKLGRQIKWYYPESDTVLTSYINSKDTIIGVIRHSSDKPNDPPFQVSKYLYNKKGKIIFYTSIEPSPEDFKKTKIIISKFYYNKNENVVALHEYSNYDYPYSVSVNFPIIDTFMNLVRVINYSYNSQGELKTQNQMLGNKDFRSVDSFFYDNNKKLAKRVSFVKQGYIGEMRFSNIYNIEEFKYTSNSVITIEKTKYDDPLKGTILQFNMSFEEVKYKSGLVKAIYLIEQNGDKSLAASYVYEYSK